MGIPKWSIISHESWCSRCWNFCHHPTHYGILGAGFVPHSCHLQSPSEALAASHLPNIHMPTPSCFILYKPFCLLVIPKQCPTWSVHRIHQIRMVFVTIDGFTSAPDVLGAGVSWAWMRWDDIYIMAVVCTCNHMIKNVKSNHQESLRLLYDTHIHRYKLALNCLRVIPSRPMTYPRKLALSLAKS